MKGTSSLDVDYFKLPVDNQHEGITLHINSKRTSKLTARLLINHCMYKHAHMHLFYSIAKLFLSFQNDISST